MQTRSHNTPHSWCSRHVTQHCLHWALKTKQNTTPVYSRVSTKSKKLYLAQIFWDDIRWPLQHYTVLSTGHHQWILDLVEVKIHLQFCFGNNHIQTWLPGQILISIVWHEVYCICFKKSISSVMSFYIHGIPLVFLIPYTIIQHLSPMILKNYWY